MPADRYLPADADLLREWVGPLNVGDRYGVWLSNAGQIIGERIGYGVADEWGNTNFDALHLDPHRPEVIALLARWLAERGTPAHHLLPTWLGGRLSTEDAGDALAWSVRSVRAGGGVLRGVLDVGKTSGWTRRATRAALSAGFALRNDDGTTTFPEPAHAR